MLHMVLQHQEPDPFWKNIVPSFRHLTANELSSFADTTWVHGWKWTTVIVDMPMYMKYLLKQFLQVLHNHTNGQRLFAL